MQQPIATHARIVRTKPTSPRLVLIHDNWCPALDGKPCTCKAVWDLRGAK